MLFALGSLWNMAVYFLWSVSTIFVKDNQDTYRIVIYLRLKSRFLNGWTEVDIFHSLTLFDYDHVIDDVEFKVVAKVTERFNFPRKMSLSPVRDPWRHCGESITRNVRTWSSKILCEMWNNDQGFHYLIWNWCQRYWTIISDITSLAFLLDRYNIR